MPPSASPDPLFPSLGKMETTCWSQAGWGSQEKTTSKQFMHVFRRWSLPPSDRRWHFGHGESFAVTIARGSTSGGFASHCRIVGAISGFGFFVHVVDLRGQILALLQGDGTWEAERGWRLQQAWLCGRCTVSFPALVPSRDRLPGLPKCSSLGLTPCTGCTRPASLLEPGRRLWGQLHVAAARCLNRSSGPSIETSSWRICCCPKTVQSTCLQTSEKGHDKT